MQAKGTEQLPSTGTEFLPLHFLLALSVFTMKISGVTYALKVTLPSQRPPSFANNWGTLEHLVQVLPSRRGKLKLGHVEFTEILCKIH